MDKKISVLLVDDHNLVRRGFRRLLEDESDIVVAGEASDGEQAIDLASSLRPDVIVMDSALPGINGLDATRKILQKDSEARVLMLSMHSEETWVQQALDAGAKGYVLKNAMDLDLASAIRRVVAGEVVLRCRTESSPQISRAKAGMRSPHASWKSCGIFAKANPIRRLLRNLSSARIP